MISENLLTLRKRSGLSQEAAADAVGVSRQTVAKWESGESVPDLAHSALLSEVYGVSLDDLVNYRGDRDYGLPLPPKGKHIFGPVRLGDRGQIVIPARARKIFKLQPGDELMLLGDEAQGLALTPMSGFWKLLAAVQGREEDA